ncbi:MAG: hypothetical protein ACE5F1_02910, partial [Planctomycetota bacterium]
NRLFLTNPSLLAVEANVPDLRGPILETLKPQPGEACYIALAGDHGRLNNDNLRLEMLRRGIRGDVWQVGYLPADFSAIQRVQAVRNADLWVVIEGPDGTPGTSWAQRYASGTLAILEKNPAVFRKVPFSARLSDCSVRVFERIDHPGVELLREDETLAAFEWTRSKEPVAPYSWVNDWSRDVDAWKGSGEARPEIEGTGKRARLTVSGDGTDSLVYSRDIPKLLPNRDFVLEYEFSIVDAQSEDTPWSLIIGTESIHRDVFRRSLQGTLLFRSRMDGDSSMRVGHYRLKGRAHLAAIALQGVAVEHRDFGLCVLGAGESIRRGRYRFQTAFEHGEMASRCLHSFSVRFHSDHYVFEEPGRTLNFRHALSKLSVSSAKASFSTDASPNTLSVTFSGDSETSVTAESSSNPGRPAVQSYVVPAQVFPTHEIIVRLRSKEGGSLPVRVWSYELSAVTDAEKSFLALGRSRLSR